MIRSREDYLEYLESDRYALGISRTRPRLFGDDIWKIERRLRSLEYYTNTESRSIIRLIQKLWAKYRLHQIEKRFGIDIPVNVFGKGLCIVHAHAIVVSKYACVGENCRIHECVTIGATNMQKMAAMIGDTVFIGPGARIIGQIHIADEVGIAPNAVVISDITESGITVGGIPAVKISNHGAKMNMPFFNAGKNSE